MDKKKALYGQNQTSYKNLIMKDNILLIEEAPEPSDIVYDNQKFDTSQKIRFRLRSILDTSILLILCVLGIGVIKMSQFLIKKHLKNSSSLIQFLSVIIGIIITVFNKFILAKFVRRIVKYDINKFLCIY